MVNNGKAHRQVTPRGVALWKRKRNHIEITSKPILRGYAPPAIPIFDGTVGLPSKIFLIFRIMRNCYLNNMVIIRSNSRVGGFLRFWGFRAFWADFAYPVGVWFKFFWGWVPYSCHCRKNCFCGQDINLLFVFPWQWSRGCYLWGQDWGERGGSVEQFVVRSESILYGPGRHLKKAF